MSKKRYAIQWEDDEPSAFEVNGLSYPSLEDVPAAADRCKLEAMLLAALKNEDAAPAFDEKEIAELSKSAPDVENVIVWIFSGIAALTLLIAGISTFLNLQKLAQEKSAPARVVDVIRRREYINEQDRIYEDYYYPVIQFTAVDGETRKVALSEGSSPAQYEVGEEVTALYNPEHPLDARIRSFGSAMLMWVVPGITGFLGLAFGGAVWMVKKYLT